MADRYLSDLAGTMRHTLLIGKSYTAPSKTNAAVPLGYLSTQAARNAVAGAVANGQFLRGDGTNTAMAAIQKADVPTLDQNTAGTSASFTGNLTGDITSTGMATAIAAGVVVNADINASAAIADTKLATIATALKVSNSATTATSASTANAIVARDASGNFSAGVITAALTGNATNVTGVVAIVNGGTGAAAVNTAFNKNYGTTAADVKMNGIQAVGTTDSLAKIDHVHPTDTTRSPAGLATAAGLTISATDKLLGRAAAGAGAVEEITCTAAARSILDDATVSDMRATMGFGTLLEQWKPVPTTLLPTSAGVKGQLYYDNYYIYICVATDTWTRHAVERSWS